ncbi:MAG: LysM peptidoglycan-binding domain-containing protein [Chloroflexota bacterium]|nr:LysM peptidoglycan-binding domain-containing protein [Chloroflexota bacterium]
MCGYALEEQKRRGGFRVPIGELVLLLVALGVAFLWWTTGAGPESTGAPPQLTAIARSVTPESSGAAASGEVAPTAALTPADSPTPAATPTPIIYTVVRGDTVERISAEFAVDVEDLLIFNGLTSDLIRIDQKLKIPPEPVPRDADGNPLPTATPTPESAIYLVVVQAGDTVDNIARRLGSSAGAIVAANEKIINADTIIRPGDQIVVPVGTVIPTATPVPVESATATPVPTPTATPGPPWPAPQLLFPLDGAELGGQPVVLQWLSVGTLAPDEVYVVRVSPEGNLRAELTQPTLGTSFRVPEDWLTDTASENHRFNWSVQVARNVRSATGQPGALWATSFLSQPRLFLWLPSLPPPPPKGG